MMKIYTTMLWLVQVLLFTFKMQAQLPVLYGMTTIGGANNKGTLFKVNGDGSGFKLLFDFTANTGGGYGDLYKAPGSGLLYGMTQAGHLPATGSIVCLNPVTDSVNVLYDFPGTNTSPTPLGAEGVVEVSDGIFYGVTNSGGANQDGAVFSFDTAGNVCNTIYSFNYPAFFHPDGRFANVNGLLYGITQDADVNSGGAIFTFNPSTDSVSVAYYFNDTGICCHPVYAPVLHNGYLYGVTTQSGANNLGMVYRFDPSDNSMLKIADFDSATSGPLTNGLMVCSNGLLYGMTNKAAGGVIYTVNPATNTLAVVYTFQLVMDSILQGGSFAAGNLTEGNDRMLYGMTNNGGLNNIGNIFRFNPDSNTYQNLFSFMYPDTNGGQPYGGLVTTGTLPTEIKPVLSNSDGITISPNPVHNSTVIKVTTNSSYDKIQMLDMLGNILSTYPVTSNRIEIKTSNLQPAIYCIKAYGLNGITLSSKLVKY